MCWYLFSTVVVPATAVAIGAVHQVARIMLLIECASFA